MTFINKKVYPATFCIIEEITPIEVFQADYITLPSEPRQRFFRNPKSDNWRFMCYSFVYAVDISINSFIYYLKEVYYV